MAFHDLWSRGSGGSGRPAVTVERVACTEANGIVAVCRRRAARQRIAVLELPLPEPPPAGAEWIEAYRSWARGAF